MRKSTSRRRAVWLAVVMVTAGVTLAGVSLTPVGGQESTASPTIDREDEATCLACHASATEETRAVDKGTLAASPHRDLKCQDCHSSITAAPHTAAMLKEKAACGTCHSDAQEAYTRGLHSYPDKKPGDHPTCVSCHGAGDPHAVVWAAGMLRLVKAELCSQCHREASRMRRYGPDPLAVESYEKSFHGKALLRFGNDRVAICSDCHGHHDVLAPEDPAAPTHRNNAAKTCSQQGCHAGARVNFAMSGANHLHLKIKDSAFLRLEEGFFNLLTVGVIGILLLGIALDLRTEVLSKTPPASGRPAGIAISLGFLLIVATLIMFYLNIPGKRWTFLLSVLLLLAALVLRFLHLRANPRPVDERKYLRLTLAQRLQHAFLALSFTGLVLSGMPLRYAEVPWLQQLYLLLGGLGVMRVVHRVCAVIMIGTWLWHTAYLLYRWKKAGFSLRSWTMLPTMKDVGDFLRTILYYLGQEKSEPKYDRFHFKEKFDYFAVYWGMPIMVLSGLVLWFPVMLGNVLPDVGVSAAIIAHSDEAVLAFLAILMWHLYNTHLHPERFPMSSVWLTGTLTESEMERDHPLELEKLRGEEQAKPT